MKNGRRKEMEAYLVRAVDSMAASPRRKRRMREELSSHFVESYQAIWRCGADEDAVVDAAIARLGDAEDLRGQLQASVPFWERAAFLFLNRKERSMRRAMAIACWAVVLLAAAWLTFSAAMISRDLFRRYPVGSEIRAARDGGLEMITRSSGGYVVTESEPYKPIMAPMLAGPFVILVGFAAVGCWSLSRKRDGAERC